VPNTWEALVAKKWDELEALEQDGRTLFMDAIRARKKGGSVVEVPIVLRVLRKDERRKAKFEARKWAETIGLDPEKEPALFDDMDTLCILAQAIRERAAPHDQHMKAAELEATYDGRSLEELWSKYKVYEDLTDPREAIDDDVKFWTTVAAIGRSASILPLTESESFAQNACIVRMAREALSSPTFSSFCGQCESSTPAP